LDIVDAILREIIEPFLARLADDSSFRSGVCSGLLVALLIGGLSWLVLHYWGILLRFFRPTRKPATEAGPSPYTTYTGAIRAFVMLAIILIPIILLVARFLGLI